MTSHLRSSPLLCNDAEKTPCGEGALLGFSMDVLHNGAYSLIFYMGGSFRFNFKKLAK